MKNLVKKIQNIAHAENLWENNSRIVLGISGGPDSVCLLDILFKISIKFPMKIHLAHVNYGLRGKDSDRDEKLVRTLAEKYQLGFSAWKVVKIKKSENNEENLRNIRYDFFEKVRKELKFDLIATAHTQDDQVETFLMRIIRGAGLRGLSGIKYKNGKIIRPLLGISKEEIFEYNKINFLPFGIDNTNKQNNFLRNKIRNKLIPYLEKNFNPGIKKTISNSLMHISEDFSLVSEKSKKILDVFPEDLRVDETLKLHPAVQRNYILGIIEKVKGDLKDIKSSHLREILKILKSKKNKTQNFYFQGLKLTRKGDRVNLIKIK